MQCKPIKELRIQMQKHYKVERKNNFTVNWISSECIYRENKCGFASSVWKVLKQAIAQLGKLSWLIKIQNPRKAQKIFCRKTFIIYGITRIIFSVISADSEMILQSNIEDCHVQNAIIF